jgi:spore coat-associated protein N
MNAGATTTDLDPQRTHHTRIQHDTNPTPTQPDTNPTQHQPPDRTSIMNTATFAPPDPTSGVAPPRPSPITPLRVTLTIAVLLLGAAALAIASLALFTDTASVPNNTFTTGTIDINATPATAVVAVSGMVPGDQDTAPLTIDNNGTLDLRYAVRSVTTEDVLAAELVLTIKSGVTTCDDANWAATGTTLYSGRLGSVAGDALIGSDTPGADAGDRTLAAAASEILCVNVTLPLATTVGQGVTTTANLSFVAEQTDNNP